MIKKEIKNIEDFLDKHGEKGYLTLYLTNYIYKFVSFILNCPIEGYDDPSYISRIEKNIPMVNTSELDSKLYSECKKEAERIVKEFESKNSLADISETNFNKTVEKIIKSFKEEKDEENDGI